MRLFFGVWLGDENIRRADSVISGLSLTGADLKTVGMENLHITVKFLGEVREDDVKKICDKASALARETSPFSLRIENLGYFGSVNFPRVVWAGISQGRNRLVKLINEFNSSLVDFSPGDRKPRPHLTLARARSVRNARELVNFIQANRSVKLGELRVKDIRLVRSDLGPQGPKYTGLETFTLGGM